MLSILVFTVVWWSLYFLLYWIVKKLINTATERQQIEIFSSPFCFLPNKRKPKKWETIYFCIGLLTIPLTFVFFFKIFPILQEGLFRDSDDVLISTSTPYWGIPSLFLSLLISGIFLIIGAKKELTPNQNWKQQPSLFKIIGFKSKLKVLIKWLNLLSFIILLVGLFSFVRINSAGVHVQSFLFKKEKHIPFNQVQQALFHIELERQSSIKNRQKVVYKPHFDLILYNNTSIQLLNSQFYTTKNHYLLKQTILKLYENNIPIRVKKVSIYDNSLYRDFFEKNRYEKIMNLFDYAQMVQEKRHQPISIGTPFQLGNISYQIDSTSIDYGEGLFTSPKGKHFERIHLTIQNNSRDTFIFVKMNTHLIDKEHKEYNISFWSGERFEGRIPPLTTHSGYISFQVPDTISPLKMRYQEGFLDKKMIYFDLE